MRTISMVAELLVMYILSLVGLDVLCHLVHYNNVDIDQSMDGRTDGQTDL